MAAKKEPAVQPAAASDKKKALETAMQQIEKMYGKGSIMRYGAESTLNDGGYPHRISVAGSGAGHRRPAPGPYRGDLRTGVLR